ncbi:MAG: ester cyclase [Nitrososphaerales archaeon]
MPVEDNKEKIKRWYASFEIAKKDYGAWMKIFDEMFAPDFILNNLDGRDLRAKDTIKRTAPQFLKILPDLHNTTELVFGEDDFVVARIKGEATPAQEVLGVKPTGKKVTWWENEIYRFKDGRIVECWGEGTMSIIKRKMTSE